MDLDGTLARHTRRKGITVIGTPIERMARRIRRWHSQGKRVKIFTARADTPESISAIKKWLEDNKLPALEVTNVKDHYMIRMWDDKAVPMVKNKGITHQDGRIAESLVDILLDSRRYSAMGDEEEEVGRMGSSTYSRDPSWVPYWMDPMGEIIRVPHHETWARKVALKDTPYENPEHRGAYVEMRRRGWVRIAVEPQDSAAYVNPSYCSKVQLDRLIDFCADNGYNLMDDSARGNPMIFNAASGGTEDPGTVSVY